MSVMQCCANPRVSDLTNGLGEQRNFYCNSCRSHLYEGRFYTRAEWDALMETADIAKPSRQEKQCSNCRFSDGPIRDGLIYCDHPEVPPRHVNPTGLCECHSATIQEVQG